jgi:Cd2+/Zn2+-exporting ATPase
MHALDAAALTGEALPRDVAPGEEILSGSINMSGLLRVRTTKEFEESTASRILDLVENASSRKAKSEQFISRFAHWYTPAVCYSALALAVLGPLVNILVLHKPGGWELWSDWIYRALTFLVISCPCAIVVSIPLTFFGGIGGAGSKGILIKGSNFMETLANVRTVVFDKTGTLTRGNFAVTKICPAMADGSAAAALWTASENAEDVAAQAENSSPAPSKDLQAAADRLLEYAALAESYSSHPISRSLKEAYGERLAAQAARVGDAEEISGKGVITEVDGRRIGAGNLQLMQDLGVLITEENDHSDVETGTIVHVCAGKEYLGHIVIADEIKPHAVEAVRDLRKAGVSRTVMLTGDAESIAARVAEKLGITEYHAELLPADKVTQVEKLLSESAGKDGSKDTKAGTLAFVGDGINDAPVLSRADIGIAMGALGSDAAIEAADVVLMDDDPVKIARAIRIARKCIRIVNENIWFAIGVKLLCLLLGALGIANMWLAIFADVGVMVLCVLNAIRALV